MDKIYEYKDIETLTSDIMDIQLKNGIMMDGASIEIVLAVSKEDILTMKKDLDGVAFFMQNPFMYDMDTFIGPMGSIVRLKNVDRI